MPRGAQIRQARGATIFRPEAVGDTRIAFVDGSESGEGLLFVTDLEGEVLVASSVGNVDDIAYDAANDVIVTLANAREISLLRPDTLEQIVRRDVVREVAALDARDGWLMLVRVDGSMAAAPITDPQASEDLVASGATAGAWLK